MNVLALVPVKPDIKPTLLARAGELLTTLGGCEKRLRICPERGPGGPYSHHAAARNAMLDAYLRPEHTHVLWIDADIVHYPPDMPARLLAVDTAAVVAPFVLIDGTDQFYDTTAFVDSDGRRARALAPYLDGGDVIPMRSVGACYLTPAAPYHAGIRHQSTAGETEHWNVFRATDTPIVAVRSIVVYHAYLPHYGEAWHSYG
jgi:hypothetical protein